jgi:hypothetical protein
MKNLASATLHVKKTSLPTKSLASEAVMDSYEKTEKPKQTYMIKKRFFMLIFKNKSDTKLTKSYHFKISRAITSF